tara:strand:+ start:20614 stop:22083 length:1470 start_codon:yes stop_codon:yes gene_type:complete
MAEPNLLTDEQERILAQRLFPAPMPQGQTFADTTAAMANPNLQTYQKPEGFGGYVRNFAQNAILEPLQYSLYMKESPRRRYDRLRSNALVTEQQQKKQQRQFFENMTPQQMQAFGISPQQAKLFSLFPDQATTEVNKALTDINLRNRAVAMGRQMSALNDAPPELQQQIAGVLATGNMEGAMNIWRQYSDSQRTPSISEYEYAKAQHQAAKSAKPFPSFQDYAATAKKKSSSIPSAIQMFNFVKNLDKEAFAKMTDAQRVELMFKILRQDAETAGEIATAQQKAKDGGITVTPGQKTVDELYAVDYAAYNALGGYTAAIRNLKDLGRVIQLLNKGGDDISGRAIGILPRAARPTLSQDISDTVERIITLDLRATIGAAFTEREGELFISRTYNVMLPPEVNAKRLQRLRAASEATHTSKKTAAEFYRKNGTLAGYEPPVLSLDGFEDAVFQVYDYDTVDDETLLEMQADVTISNAEFEAIMGQIEKREN